MDILMILGFVVFIIMAAVVFWKISTISGSSDAKTETQDALKLISGVVGGLTVVLAFLSFVYYRTNPRGGQVFTMVLAHLAIAVSFIAAGISAVNKL